MHIKKSDGSLILRLFVCLLLVAISPLQSLSLAEAETAKYRVFTYATKMEVLPIGFVKAPANIIIERRGLAHFENGDVAIFVSRGTIKGTPKGGAAEGYSLLTYNDGSTTVVQWDVKYSVSEATKLSSFGGSGKFIKGTGRFTGIQGDMVISGQEITPFTDETKSDAYFDVTANYTLPSK